MRLGVHGLLALVLAWALCGIVLLGTARASEESAPPDEESEPGDDDDSADEADDDEADDDEADDALFSMSLEELLAVEVGSAGAAPRAVASAPADVLVVTREQMLRRGYRSLSDVLQDLPGFEIHDRSNGEWDEHVSIRGINGNDRYLILQDGHRISSISSSYHSMGPNFSLANAKRVEVVIGPSSALYGADAFAAVINIVTRDGAEVDGLEASGSFGFYNTTHDSLTVGFEKGPIDVLATGTFYFSKDPDMTKAWPDQFAWWNDRYQADGVVRASVFSDESDLFAVDPEPFAAPQLAYYAHGRVTLFDQVSLSYTRHSHKHSSSLATRPEFTLWVSDATWQYDIDSVVLQHGHDLADGVLRLDGSLAWNSYRLNPNSRYMNTFSGYTAGGFKYAQHMGVRFEERLTIKPLEQLDFSVGFAVLDLSAQPKGADLPKAYDPNQSAETQDLVYTGTDIVDRDGNDLSIPIDVHRVRSQNVGIYGEVGARPWSWLEIVAGVRGDINTRFGPSISPRGNVIIRPIRPLRFRLSYSSAFLAPSPYNAYQHFGSFVPVTDEDGEVTGLQSFFMWVPNPDLKPERLHMFEFSAAGSILDVVQLDGNAWFGRIDDGLADNDTGRTEFKGWPAGLVMNHRNFATSWYWGATAAVRARIVKGLFKLEPWVSYTWTDGREDDPDPRGGGIQGNPLPIAAKHKVKGGVDLGIHRLSLSLRLRYRSSANSRDQFEADGTPVQIPGSLVGDLHVRYTDVVRLPRFRLSPWIDVRNFWNERYSMVCICIDGDAGSPQDPIRLLAGFDLRI